MSDSGKQDSKAFEITSSEVIYECSRFHLEILNERGLDGVVRERQVVRHRGAAVVLPIRKDGKVVLVEQHRSSIGRLLLEVPAGILDPGEDPFAAAKRELAEETGYRAGHWKLLQSFYPAPGITDECMHLYMATELEAGEAMPDEDEWVEIKSYDASSIRQMLESGAITDGKTLVALYAWLAQETCQEGKS